MDGAMSFGRSPLGTERPSEKCATSVLVIGF